MAAQHRGDRAVADRRRLDADQPSGVPVLRAQLLEVPGGERARPLRGEAPSRQAAAAVLDQRAEVARTGSPSACVERAWASRTWRGARRRAACRSTDAACGRP